MAAVAVVMVVLTATAADDVDDGHARSPETFFCETIFFSCCHFRCDQSVGCDA